MNLKLNGVRKSGDVALGRNRKVVAHGTPEPFEKGGEADGKSGKVPCSKSFSNGGICCHQKGTSPGKMTGSN